MCFSTNKMKRIVKLKGTITPKDEGKCVKFADGTLGTIVEVSSDRTDKQPALVKDAKGGGSWWYAKDGSFLASEYDEEAVSRGEGKIIAKVIECVKPVKKVAKPKAVQKKATAVKAAKKADKKSTF